MWFWEVGGKNWMHAHCTMSVRLRKDDLTCFSDCHRCCFWVSVHCNTPSFHLFTFEDTTTLTRALIFPNVQTWDTSLHLGMRFGFFPPPQAQQRESLHLHYVPSNNHSSTFLSIQLGEWQQVQLHVSHPNLLSAALAVKSHKMALGSLTGMDLLRG